ncbi:P-loop containing nucleoside triphosphate hydrolase protein [Paraphysoderma sedebokerense]|nr:P-loop containing nucleoside triphosphate hydrolase protein [Paraphysoderma sedebokerense]KAI9138455.1 P-loop containing nucleoside triphosphate hydrolase protein [Paraphysoderma sedebokerense]
MPKLRCAKAGRAQARTDCSAILSRAILPQISHQAMSYLKSERLETPSEMASGPENVDEFIKRLEAVCSLSSFTTSGIDLNAATPSFDGVLYEHQIEGVEWLLEKYTAGLNVILGDDMGLGKTVQIIRFLSVFLDENMWKNCLIVVPAALLNQWKTEVQR